MPEFSSYEIRDGLWREYSDMRCWRTSPAGGNSIRQWMNSDDWSPADYKTRFASEYTNLKSAEVHGEIDIPDRDDWSAAISEIGRMAKIQFPPNRKF